MAKKSNKKRKNRKKEEKRVEIPKKLLSAGVALSMLCSSTIPASAMLDITKNNTPEQNQKLLEQVTELAKDTVKTPEQKLYELQNLGVIGEEQVKKVLDGATKAEKEQFAAMLAEIMSSDVIHLNGAECTLDTIRQMLADPDVDLTQKVDVDGIEVTMENLKTMVEIEDQIQRIAGSVMFAEDLNEQQRAEYDSIINQLNTDGIELLSEEETGLQTKEAAGANDSQQAADDGVSVLAADDGIVYDHTARISYQDTYDNIENTNHAVTVTFTQPALELYRRQRRCDLSAGRDQSVCHH